MKFNNILENILQSFLYADKEKVLKKLKYLISSKKDKLHIVSDFDRTLTKNKKKKKDITTWLLIEKKLPLKARQKCQLLYDHYRPLEIQNKMTTKDAANWWEQCLKVHVKAKLKWPDLACDVGKLSPRPYIHKLFNLCYKKNIPIIILSAGIKDFIELWCQDQNLKPTLVLSNKLIFSPKGYLLGWHKDSLIHVLNKKEKSHKELSHIRATRPNVILLGDSIDDAAMVDGDKNILRILIENPRKDERIHKNKAYRNIIFQKFDLIIKEDTFYPVIKILNLL